MADLKIDIGEAQITNAIAVGIAESFSADKRDALLRDIVRAHLQYKRNSYDKETLLSGVIGEHVRAIATEKTVELIKGMSLEIGAVVERTLGPRFKESILTQLENSLAHRVISGVSVRFNIDEE